jgi:hypothetical protein
MASEIDRLTTKQLVALRFASDGELPGLVKQILGGSIAEQDDIKKAIQHWRADNERI